MIDIEKLIKYIKLANDNPNEHEANIAARRVCKMLVNDKKEFIFKIVNKPKPPENKPWTSPHTGATYNDIKKSTEPKWKNPSYHKQASNPFNSAEYSSWFEDAIRNARKYSADQWAPSNPEREKDQYGPGEVRYEPSKKQQEYDHKKKYDRNAEPRILKCKKCNKDRPTKFVGLEEFFICHDCMWLDI